MPPWSAGLQWPPNPGYWRGCAAHRCVYSPRRPRPAPASGQRQRTARPRLAVHRDARIRDGELPALFFLRHVRGEVIDGKLMLLSFTLPARAPCFSQISPLANFPFVRVIQPSRLKRAVSSCMFCCSQSPSQALHPHRRPAARLCRCLTGRHRHASPYAPA